MGNYSYLILTKNPVLSIDDPDSNTSIILRTCKNMIPALWPGFFHKEDIKIFKYDNGNIFHTFIVDTSTAIKNFKQFTKQLYSNPLIKESIEKLAENFIIDIKAIKDFKTLNLQLFFEEIEGMLPESESKEWLDDIMNFIDNVRARRSRDTQDILTLPGADDLFDQAQIDIPEWRSRLDDLEISLLGFNENESIDIFPK
ncbi:MAG: hypothetical protein V1872_10025 [bacterium]